jgi:hypothetical protein
MIIETLVNGFVAAFVLVAVFGHVLLIQAYLTPPVADEVPQAPMYPAMS